MPESPQVPNQCYLVLFLLLYAQLWVNCLMTSPHPPGTRVLWHRYRTDINDMPKPGEHRPYRGQAYITL